MSIDSEFEGFWLDVLSGKQELDVMPQGLNSDKTKALHLAQTLRSVLIQNADKQYDDTSLDDDDFVAGILTKLKEN